MHKVCAEIYAVGYMDECGMTVIIRPDSSWALTTLSMTPRTSHSEILLVYSVPNIAFALSPNYHLQIEIELVGCLSA